jgi:hypothetical protein
MRRIDAEASSSRRFYARTALPLRDRHTAQRTGRPRLYADAQIEAMLLAKVALRLSLRAVEGLAYGLAKLAHVSWPVPDYTTLCRREGKLAIDLRSRVQAGKRHVPIVDSTGLKVMGEGEWKVRIHDTGGGRRTWRKIHLLVDRETGHILAEKTTDKNTADCTVLPALLPEDLAGDHVLGDGAYHTQPLHRLVYARGGNYRTPPPRGARVWKPYHWKSAERAFRWRNAELTRLARLGRTQWKIATGLSQRSFVESTMRRLKALTGAHLSARSIERQNVEVRLRCQPLNRLAVSTWTVPA